MIYKIYGQQAGGKKSLLDTTTSKKDAYYLIGEYRMAFGKLWSIWCPQLEVKQ